MTAPEVWRPIPGCPGYEASSLGRIRSMKRAYAQPKILSPHPDPAGYYRVGVRVDGRSVHRLVHKLVALAFYGPRPEGLVTRHLDGDSLNNSTSNLRYGTFSENEQDKLRHGRHTNANKTHCPRRHPYTAENTYMTHRGTRRACRTCTLERNARNRLRRQGRLAA